MSEPPGTLQDPELCRIATLTELWPPDDP